MNAVDLVDGQTSWKILFGDEHRKSVWKNFASRMNVVCECMCMLHACFICVTIRAHTHYFDFSPKDGLLLQLQDYNKWKCVQNERTNGQIKMKSKWRIKATKQAHYENHIMSYAELFRISDRSERSPHESRCHTRTHTHTTLHTYPVWNAGICIMKTTIHREWAILIKLPPIIQLFIYIHFGSS